MSKSTLPTKNKKLLAIAVGGIIAVGALVGGNVYADKSLKEIYAVKDSKSAIKLTKVDYNMGTFSGDVNWEAEIIIDPCAPQDKILIKGKDTVKRGLMGYNIHSEITSDAEAVKNIFKDKPVLTLDSHLGWSGTADVKLNSPVLNANDGVEITWNGLQGQFQMKKDKEEFSFKNVQFNMPGFNMKGDGKELSFNNIYYKVDQAHSKTIVPSKAEFGIGSINFLDIKKVNLNDVKFVHVLTTQKDKLSLNEKLSIKDGAFDKYKLNTFELNGVVQDIATVDAQKFFDDFSDSQQVCLTESERKNKILQSLLPILNKGMKLESTKNLVKVNDSSQATLDFNAVLKPNTSNSLQQFMQDVGKNVQFDMNASVDKGFIRMVNPTISDSEIAQIAAAYGAKTSDTSIVVSKKFENGQLK